MKKVCQISTWEDALGPQYEPLPYLKNFLIIPLKVTIFEKFRNCKLGTIRLRTLVSEEN
jgi:hypothetical protein